jgi:hypothetical protein
MACGSALTNRNHMAEVKSLVEESVFPFQSSDEKKNNSKITVEFLTLLLDSLG